jgi:hypothetical protein
VNVKDKFEHLDLQVEEDEVMISCTSHDGGRLSDEQYPAIHHFQELLVAWIHEEAHEYKGYFEVGREASLV